MATKYDAILLYSDDIWNNDRESEFKQAKVISKGQASESECETFFPCGLYYEKGTTDDTGYQCLSITAEEVDVQGTKMTVISVTLRNPSGQMITLQYPEKSRKFPVQFGGLRGDAVTFYIDGAETYRNSKGAKEKAKKFIEARIEKLRSCDAPFAAESMEMGMEEMASEFSVERINPTPVAGKADMKAESFGAEENLAVADVDIHDGMNIPAGSGAIIGQAIPETDFTPFGASAEDAPVPADPRVSPLNKGLHTPSDSPEMAAEYEYKELTLENLPKDSLLEMIESGKDIITFDGEREELDDNSDLDSDYIGTLGEYFQERIDGANRSRQKNPEYYKDQKIMSGAESFGAENPPVPADPRVSPLNKGLHTPSDSPDLSAEYDFQNQTITTITADNEDEARETFAGNYDSTKEEWKIVDVRKAENMGLSAEENLAIQDVEIWDGMVLPEGTGNIMGQMTPAADFTPFGVSAEQAADPMPNESAIIGQTSDGTPYTRFGYAAENLAVADVDIHDGMNIPAGSGAIVGQAIPETDFTPFGASAESFSADVEMIECGNCDETFTIDEGLDIGGIDYCEECYDTISGAEDMEAEAFGGDLASLDGYNGVESVRVEAPLGHGVTENLGAEEMDAYGGMMGVAAAFAAGLAFRHWSKSKIDGDDAPDSETPAEESDDAPQA